MSRGLTWRWTGKNAAKQNDESKQECDGNENLKHLLFSQRSCPEQTPLEHPPIR